MTCDYCNKNFDSCGGCCKPAKYGCDFDINANPFDPSVWNVTINGATARVKIPKSAETDTKLSTSYSAATLTFDAEKHTDTITGDTLGSIVNLSSLRDVDAKNADSCSILAFHPYCSECGDGCTPKDAKWTAYTIPDAGTNTLSVDNEGYYKVLSKTDCGCIRESRLPIIPSGMVTLDYMRDSVPDDPDFPWYYGCYNDRINLHLAENAPTYFGKYALKVTVHYGVQAIKSDPYPFNYNWRSLVVPVVADGAIRADMASSILQNWAAAGSFIGEGKHFPWGTSSLRGSLTFIVPKGKEAYLHHEFRVRVAPSDMQYGVPAGQTWPNYLLNSNYDGKKVPDAEATLNSAKWPASRLNSLQVIIEPTVGEGNYSPVADAIRSQLDAPEDVIPNSAAGGN